MTVSEKTKTIDNKIEQDKAQYNLNRQTARVSSFSSENFDKYEFNIKRCLTRKILTRKSCLQSKDLNIYH